MMTAKARSLGMSRTTYANASGLPNPHQVTTARDQAILGRAIQAQFPRHYRYFATNSFRFRGREIHTHNRLLGQVEGVDGIKTGYTHAAGFNLVTSVRRDRRHIVAVVIGGRTGRSRDAFMRKLINEYIDDASTGRATPPRTAEAPVAEPTAPAAEASANLAASQPQPAAPPDPAALPVSLEASASPVPDAGAAEAEPAPGVQVATAVPADRPIVLADASLTLAAVRKSERTEATAARTWGYPSTVPPWFPYLLVAFIGCIGSLLSAFFSVVPTRLRWRLPQSA
jgi:D-alanyl-D-alanine carboxypeptidase